MAGAFISVDLIGQKEIDTALQQIIDHGNNLIPAFEDIGELLLDIHEQRFKDQISPDGVPWAEVKPATLKNKKRKDRILREEGTLADLLTYQINGQQLLFGTNTEYGATHQFGRESANIVARPWLGLSDEQEVSVLDIITRYIQTG